MDYFIENGCMHILPYFNRKFTSRMIEKLNTVSKIEFLAHHPYFNIESSDDDEDIQSISIFNQPLENIPSNIKEIYLGDCFNKSVNNLPIGLEKIVFGYNFNRCVDFLPITLKYVEFGAKFNKSIDNLPNLVEEIYLDKDFDKVITKFPSNLRKIGFHISYKDIILPETNAIIKYYPYKKIF